jgi:hypothetical protein
VSTAVDHVPAVVVPVLSVIFYLYGFCPAVDRGYLLLSHHWQDQMGDLAMTGRLAGVERLAAEAGLTLVLTLNPFVSTDSLNFQEGVKQGLFVMERNSSSQTRNIPALTWFKVQIMRSSISQGHAILIC